MNKISSYLSRKKFIEDKNYTSNLDNRIYDNSYIRYIGKMESSVSYPLPELTPYIEKYIFYENVNITNDVYLKTISNGKVELFIHYNHSYIVLINGKKEIKLSNFIAGVSDIGIHQKIKPVSGNDCFKGISVVLSFQGLYKLFGIRTKSITNRLISLEEILRKYGKYLTEYISEAKCTDERKNILNGFFLQLLRNDKNENKYLFDIYNIIIAKNGCLAVNELSKYLNVTCRTIHRMFIEYIGISPKNYLRIIRFNYACKLLCKYPEINWSDIIYDCGYYDQMHFIHEFKDIMKNTPMKLLKASKGNLYFNRPVIVI